MIARNWREEIRWPELTNRRWVAPRRAAELVERTLRPVSFGVLFRIILRLFRNYSLRAMSVDLPDLPNGQAFRREPIRRAVRAAIGIDFAEADVRTQVETAGLLCGQSA